VTARHHSDRSDIARDAAVTVLAGIEDRDA
jgi:hypothetical protein